METYGVKAPPTQLGHPHLHSSKFLITKLSLWMAMDHGTGYYTVHEAHIVRDQAQAATLLGYHARCAKRHSHKLAVSYAPSHASWCLQDRLALQVGHHELAHLGPDLGWGINYA